MLLVEMRKQVIQNEVQRCRCSVAEGFLAKYGRSFPGGQIPIPVLNLKGSVKKWRAGRGGQDCKFLLKRACFMFVYGLDEDGGRYSAGEGKAMPALQGKKVYGHVESHLSAVRYGRIILGIRGNM
jgi:hypothetical protein